MPEPRVARRCLRLQASRLRGNQHRPLGLDIIGGGNHLRSSPQWHHRVLRLHKPADMQWVTMSRSDFDNSSARCLWPPNALRQAPVDLSSRWPRCAGVIVTVLSVSLLAEAQPPLTRRPSRPVQTA
jgi:hypothetical protein